MALYDVKPRRWAMMHDAFGALAGNDPNMTGRVMEQEMALRERQRREKMAQEMLQPQMAPTGAAMYPESAPQGVPHQGATYGEQPIGTGLMGNMMQSTGENTMRSRLAAEAVRGGDPSAAYNMMQPQQPDLPSGQYTPESMQQYTQTGNYADLVPYESPGKDFRAGSVAFDDGENYPAVEGPDGSVWIETPEGRVDATKYMKDHGNYKFFTTGVQSGFDEAGIQGDKSSWREYNTLERAIPVAENLRSRVLEGLRSGKFTGTQSISGSLSKGINSLHRQALTLARNSNDFSGEDPVLLDPNQSNLLRDVTSVNTKVKSAILDLAYMTLKAKAKGDRVSNFDLQTELESYGLDTNDPAIIADQLESKIENLYENYEEYSRQLETEPRYSFKPNEGGGGSLGKPEGVSDELWEQIQKDAESYEGE